WWMALALGAEALAYLGYTFAYREVSRVEQGPSFEPGEAAALVATGFGAFVARGGFALGLHAFQRAAGSDRDARVRVLGAGAVEALLPFALSWAGMPLASAVLGVLMYRLINLWLPIVPATVGLRAVRSMQPG